jgi:5-methylcytosine-specific restriction endonuclease McrA
MQNIKKCKICGKVVKPARTYCSLKCYWKKSPKFKTECKQCGKVFLTYPSWQKGGQGFLCSKICKSKWISENYRGEKSKAGFRNAQLERTCKYCSKNFKEYKSRVKGNRGIFCCKDCYNKWFSDFVKIKENALRWIDGKSFLPYPPEFNRRLKAEIKERDNFTCQYCGSKEKLSIHHMDFDKNNNDRSNLITACTSCNSSIGGGKYNDKLSPKK